MLSSLWGWPAKKVELDADDPIRDDAVLVAAVARGVVTAAQAAAARATRDAACLRGEQVGLLTALVAILDPARREELGRLRELTVTGPPPSDEPTRVGNDERTASGPDATRWVDATAMAFARGVPSELGGATRKFADVLRPGSGADETFLSFDGGGPSPASAPTPGADERTQADPPRLRGAPGPGTVIAGRFEVVSELGRGGMGAVYRARDRQAGVEVALKLIPDELGTPERRERFLREGEVAAGFDHPGIVRVHAVGQADGRPYIAAELVPGCRTLDQVLPGLGRDARVGLIRDAARALGHAHARGVSHRDVKPGNLLIDDRGRLKVADFGLALATDHDRLTRTGVQLGTPSFMAPEQVDAARDAQGPWTDVWALGVILYEALCGVRPFKAPSFAQLCMAITRGGPAPPRSLDPSITTALEQVALGALQVDRAARPQDGEAFARALDRALEERPGANETPTIRLAPKDAPQGERVGPYAIVRQLGEGGAGVVYEARGADGRAVALKVLHPPAGKEGEAQVERFARETNAASRLRHAGIAQVLDSGQTKDGRRYIALELITGEPLIVRLKREGPLDEVEAAKLALSVCRALEHAHAQGVLHRDVKPHNVLLSPSGPKLVDFGLARSVGDSTLTAKGAMLGTPGYLPPEQAEKQLASDARADIYGLGATLYHMVTGRPPFVGDTLGQVLMAVLKKLPASPSSLRPGLSPAIEQVVLTCLQKDRDDRYADAAALAADLERVIRGQPVPPFVRRARRPATAMEVATLAVRGASERRMLVLASGVVLAALAASAVIVGRTNEATERKLELERLAEQKAAGDAELERLRAEAATRDREQAEREEAARRAAAVTRPAEGPASQPPAQPGPPPAQPGPPPVEPPPRPRDPAPLPAPAAPRRSPGERVEREVVVLGFPRWLPRRLAAARIWGREAPGWAFALDEARREAAQRRVPAVLVVLAPEVTQLPRLLRDPAALAELEQRAVLVLVQRRDKRFHDEDVDERAEDHGEWPGRDDQVCPIARTAPCEVHDRCADQYEATSLPRLIKGERSRIAVLDGRSDSVVAVITDGGADPGQLGIEPTLEGLREGLRRAAELDAGAPILQDELIAAHAELAAAELPESGPVDVATLARAARAFTPHLRQGLLGGVFARWANREGTRIVAAGRTLVAARPAAREELRAALGEHPVILERILAP